MPGYKKVVGETMNEYEIDNEVLNLEFKKKKNMENELTFFIPEEISNSDCSFDADAERLRMNGGEYEESGESMISIEYDNCTEEPGSGGERTQKHVEKQQVLNID